jgi:[protein-PII] uridylyltransferase
MTEANATRPPRFRDALLLAEDAEAIAALLKEERERRREANQAQPQGIRACRGLTEVCDQAIQRMLQLCMPQDPAARDEVRPKISVVATGGYGRRELCPFSDIDVTFVVGGEEDPDLDRTVRQMFLMVMETFGQRLGIKVGYGYRTLSDAAHLDHQTQTSLLDIRVITGSHGLAERRAAWDRHGGSLHLIEPEVREGPGGLRDLHLAEWLAAASFPSTRGDVWRQLVRMGAVSERDAEQMSAAREFLLLVRTWMHWHTNRSADLLLRERQEGLATALGFQDDDHASLVERFMERFYEHTENVSRVTGFMVDRCLTELLSLTPDLVCSGADLHPAFPWIQVATPRFLVDLGRHYQEHGLVPGYELRRMLAQHLASCPDLGADSVAAEGFVDLLRAPAPAPLTPAPAQPQREARFYLGEWDRGAPRERPTVYDTLKLMADLGGLQRLIPELGIAYRRVPFDQVHRHTIGAHSMDAVRSVDALRTTTEERLEQFRRAWSDVHAPELVYLAALLHDIGKLANQPGHAESGAEMVGQIGGRLRLPVDAISAVQTLVRHHLLMSETAQLRDLNHEKTIQDFTQIIDTPDLLNMLFLLTYADIEATGVMSAMKARFLEDLYFRAEAALATPAGARANSAVLDAERAQRFRSRISRRLAASNLTPEQIREHTAGMPVPYLLNTRPEQIAIHIRMVEALLNSGPAVEFETDIGPEITTIHLCSLDRPQPGLLSQVAGVLYAHDIEIHGAQVFTRNSSPRVALDTLWADYHGRSIPPLKRMELEQDLISSLGDGDVEALIHKLRRALPAPIPPLAVRVDNEAVDSQTLVEVQAQDQPALLYRVTRSMAALGWNIHSARISTRGDIARDVFYVTNQDGDKLEDDEAKLVEAFIGEFAR